MILAVFVAFMLVGFLSLATDYGRVQVVKLQLQSAVDSAARYAASGLSDGTALARAIDAADDNLADGTPVVLTTDDIVPGHWNESTGLFSPGTIPFNAVRITARRTKARGNPVTLSFATLLGMQTCDVQASAVARMNGGTAGDGFAGLENIEFGNNFYGASYDSTQGAPGNANTGALSQFSSNAQLKFGNNADIHGHLATGPTGSVQKGTNFQLTGQQTTLAQAISHPPTEAPPGSGAALNQDNNKTVTLSAGTYHYSSINFGNNGTIKTTGPVTIYLSGDMSVGNSFTFEAYQNKPSNLKIRLHGTGKKIDSGNDFTATAEIYGPGFEINTGNNMNVRGAVVAKMIKGGNNAEFYADINATSFSGGVATPATISLVD